MGRRIQIDEIRVKDLVAFAADAARRKPSESLIPISASRAFAWSHNPQAKPDDVGLFVAYYDSKCVGHLGVVPSQVKLGSTVEGVSWLSIFYVDPEYRSLGIGAMLLLKAAAMKTSLAANGAGGDAHPIYTALKFHQLPALPFCNLDFSRINVFASVRRGVDRVMRASKFRSDTSGDFPNLFQDGIKRIVYPTLIQTVGGDRSSPNATRGSHVPDGYWQGILDRERPYRFCRDDRVVNWMLEQPWTTCVPNDQNARFHFNDYRRQFDHRLYNIHSTTQSDNGGFVVLWLADRNGHRDIRVLDWHLTPPMDVRTLVHFALMKAKEFNADSIYLPSCCAPILQSSPVANALYQNMQRPYFIRPYPAGGLFESSLNKLALDYCDGDTPFA
jgi:GNAT superfamily N-acetyltransferase